MLERVNMQEKAIMYERATPQERVAMFERLSPPLGRAPAVDPAASGP